MVFPPFARTLPCATLRAIKRDVHITRTKNEDGLSISACATHIYRRSILCDQQAGDLGTTLHLLRKPTTRECQKLRGFNPCGVSHCSSARLACILYPVHNSLVREERICS